MLVSTVGEIQLSFMAIKRTAMWSKRLEDSQHRRISITDYLVLCKTDIFNSVIGSNIENSDYSKEEIINAHNLLTTMGCLPPYFNTTLTDDSSINELSTENRSTWHERLVEEYSKIRNLYPHKNEPLFQKTVRQIANEMMLLSLLDITKVKVTFNGESDIAIARLNQEIQLYRDSDTGPLLPYN